MDNNWQVCSPVVQAKSQHINDIATQLRSFPVAKLHSAMWKVVS